MISKLALLNASIATALPGLRHFALATVLASASVVSASDNTSFFGEGSSGPSARGVQDVNDGEQQERNVDEAALSAQSAAASNLQSVAAKYRGNADEEPAYLYRLADILQQKAQMDFRVGHGRVLLPTSPNSKSRTGKPELQGYQRDMKSSIEALDRLISKYPKFAEMPRARFMRGRAHEELGQIPQATADYVALYKAAPQAPETIPALMSLAEFAAVANHHAQAIGYLQPIEKRVNDPYYPFALYKMAWSYFNLHQIRTALTYSERLISFYTKRSSQGEAVAASRALRESILKDVPVFFFSAYEDKTPGYEPKAALAYFRKLSPGEAGAADRGKMVALYGKLLRSNDHQKDLVAWKGLVLASEGNNADSFELLLTTFEHQLNQSRYLEVVDTSRDIVPAYRKSGDADMRTKAEKLVFDGATRIQARLVKETQKKSVDSDYVQQLSTALAALYGSFTQLVVEADPRVRAVHFNLAETLFVIHQFDKAAANYRWIVEHGSWSENAQTAKAKTGGITVREAALKSIASRYEALHARNQAGAEIKARSFSTQVAGEVPGATAEWLAWIDQYQAKTNDMAVDNFAFEANRSLYAQGKIRESVARLRAFALERPKSQYAIPSATLVLDTYIASSDWNSLAELSRDMAAVPAWKGTSFSKRVAGLAADAHFKQAQTLAAHKDYDAAIEQADSLTSNYGAKGAHAAESFALAGDAALAKKDPDLAIRYYGKLAAASPRSEQAQKAYLAMAKVEEDRYGFSNAARYYRNYLAIKPGAGSELKTRALTLAWLGQDPSQLKVFANDRLLCAADTAQCTRIKAMMPLIDDSVSAATARHAAQNARRASSETRAIWAATALERPENLSSRDRRAMMETLASSWSHTEALARFALLPRISVSVPRAFALERQALSGQRLSATASSITSRLKRVQELEAFGARAAELPWTRVRALVLSEAAQSYTDYAQALRALPAPKKLNAASRQAYDRMVGQTVAPFEQKAYSLRAQALALAARPAADTEAVSQVGDAALKAGYPAGRLPRVSAVSLDLSFLRSVDSRGDWSNNATPETRADALRAAWTRALDRGTWPQVGFFMQEAREKQLLSPIALASARAVSLARAGAQAEGRLELSPYCGALSGDLREGCPSGGARRMRPSAPARKSPPSRLARKLAPSRLTKHKPSFKVSQATRGAR
jgi:tetratricopeptide (TPR) repeat protein